jgi:hypothetical protein
VSPYCKFQVIGLNPYPTDYRPSFPTTLASILNTQNRFSGFALG